VDTWNVYKKTINGNHRTNNICESLNNTFSHLVGHRPQSSDYLDTNPKMRLEAAADKAKLSINNSTLWVSW